MVRELYHRFTYDIVIDQFDSEYIENQIRSRYRPQHQILYDKFKETLKLMNEDELKNVIRFITGAEIIPVLPKIKVFILLNILLNFVKYIFNKIFFLFRFRGSSSDQMKLPNG